MADSINPTGGKNKSSDFLPRIYRSDANKKFLQATVDQLVQPGTVKRVNGFIGRQNAKATTGSDIFLKAASKDRQDYQLEPGLVIKDTLGNTTFFKDYQDYINQLSIFGGNVKNHARLNSQEFYSWDPHIDWDKFVNFQNYYWLPYGPDAIKVIGQAEKIESTYDVTIESQLDNNAYIFSSESALGLVRNPTIKLYKGQTYKFNINSPGNPFSIKRLRTPGSLDRYQDISLLNNSIESGTITFTVPYSAPDVLYYVSEFDANLGGVFEILSIEENTKIDVSTEIIGKKTYTLSDGTALSNGMKVTFVGKVTPAEYDNGYFYVEGVGKSITLVNEKDLELVGQYTASESVAFDSTPFDSMPFSDATAYAGKVDYIVINRSSKDRNPWSRYNRWFHKDVIEASAKANGQPTELDQTKRAVRPIIEFESNLKMFNFGTVAIADVNLIDTYTTDVFSNIEGQLGYNIDGIDLAQGHRILFTADTDKLVKNKIYRVEFLVLDGIRRIHLVEETTPVSGNVVLVKQGNKNQGEMYWYDGTNWNIGQQKTTLNQSPLFDVVDNTGTSFGDKFVYDGSTFTGTKLFSYKIGSGTSDSNLGFALSYKSISNIGDIVFNFNLLSDTFLYKEVSNVLTVSTNVGFLVKTEFDKTTYVNGWQKATTNLSQMAVRVYKNTGKVNNFDIDIFDDIQDLSDLVVKVYVNGIRLNSDKWTLQDSNVYKTVVLDNDIETSDVLSIRAFSKQPINENGYYEVPCNVQNNPLNDQITEFTLGEVIDHVNSIVDNIPGFVGSFPGANNLRDLGNIAPYGTKFVQHSGPGSLALYHITSEDNNIVRAIEKARDDYNRFKRNFITVAGSIGIDADTVDLVDLILEKINKDKPKSHPYYLSDMVPYGAKIKTTLAVVDPRIKYYPLTTTFSLTELSTTAVGVYLNGEQLLHEHQYEFDSQGFVVILDSVALQENDEITIYEYDNTNGSFVPPTPTKLGIWPSYDPKIYVDNTYLTPRTMIQGHDGSIILAYGDYRDDLILELEKRIYNNIKISYDVSIFNINDIVPGYSRNTPYSLEEFNEVLAPSFYNWTSLIDRDFSKPLSYDRNNSLTYNYRGQATPDGRETPGFWRGVYRWMFDTDRPNLCPWEMLGFTDEPAWWQSVYGPAPYTSDNLPMWKDLADGAVREPGKSVVILEQYKRPVLNDHIPVDEQGNVKSPLLSGLTQGIITSTTSSDFVFGDCSPIETTWRRSSFYPFGVLIAAMILQPAKTFGLVLDRSRIVKNIAGQFVYKDTGLRVSPKSIQLPSIYSSSEKIQTAGIINYIIDYILSDNLKSYDSYQYDLDQLTSKLSHRIGGFTSKEKLNLILDSRTPLSQGNVFVPQEDYDIVLNSSSPIKKITYSGVIITKLSDGFEIKGYSKSQPYFKYYPWLETGVTVNIGGISESYSAWTSNVQYAAGKIVRYNNKYYRSKVLHTTTDVFDDNYYQSLTELPIIGGRSALIRTLWDRATSITVPYGTKFSSIQEVVDFLLGYGEWLKDQGFIFDEFNNTLNAVTNWETSAKEFLFWTTQNWSTGEDKWDEWLPNSMVSYGSIVRYNGDYYRAIRTVEPSAIFNEDDYVKLDGLSTVGSSVISLSPAAAKLTFSAPLSVVDDIRNSFNPYEIFKVDGTSIAPNFLNSYREDNAITYVPQDTDGIYGATFYLVQKEQVVILNNTTIFNDTIYNPTSGYRQERIKVSGYINTDWNGSFNIPGFIFDQAVIQEWEGWKDYALGDIVKYKEFYYSAKSFLPGSVKFNASDWIKLDKKPTPQMLPNWSYKATQFTDFYSLDSDNFDVDQQTVAQHLVGYQKRQYLSNIIQDSVSEFKFYQGMIVEKGTQNVLNKLFDVLSADGQESLSFHEEWAIRVGQYGANQAFENIEFVLDESKFKSNPQGIELVDSINPEVVDFIYRQTSNDVYLKPLGYNNNPWPTKASQSYLRSPGHVRSDEVKVSLKHISDIVNEDVSQFDDGDYVWASFENDSWNVYRYTDADLKVVNVEYTNGQLIIECDDNVTLSEGSFIGISQVTGFSGFYKVDSVSLTKITIIKDELIVPNPFNEQNNILVFVLKPQRVKNVYDVNDAVVDYAIDNLDSVLPRKLKENELVWVDDNGSGKWATMKNTPVYSFVEVSNPTPAADLYNGRQVLLNRKGNILLSSNSLGEIGVYYKVGSSADWYQIQIIKPQNGLGNLVGDVLAISPDAKWLASGVPLSGKVFLYEKDDNNIFTLVDTVESPTPIANDRFGFSVVFGNNMMVVSAPGNGSTVAGCAFVYEYSGTAWEYQQLLPAGTLDTESLFGYKMDISADGTTLAISSVVDVTPAGEPTVVGRVFVYSTVDYSVLGTLTGEDRTFGQSVAVSTTGEYVAIGTQGYDSAFNYYIDQGKVSIYKNQTIYQTITSRIPETSQYFGSKIFFSGQEDSLVVYSSGADTYTVRNFTDDTTFDKSATRFVDSQADIGRVDVYDKYFTKWVFAESLENDVTDVSTTDTIGDSIAVSENQILVSVTEKVDTGFARSGKVYSYTKPAGKVSWVVLHQETDKPDISRIKKAFLYNKETNKLVTHIDVLDPVQGKIPGIADQEVKYKTYYDPAIYSVGTSALNVDDGLAWTSKNVGMLWWDLREAKFLESYDSDVVYRNSTWNSLATGASINVYEWVESEFLPVDWDSITDTEEGLASGISGTTLYGNDAYSVVRRYDNISKTFKNTYYFWVKNKKTIPNVLNRYMSAQDVADMIGNPRGEGYRYLAITSSNSFSLVNVRPILEDTNVVLSVEYWKSSNITQNVHSQWKLISNNELSEIPAGIEAKWFDSLCGKDLQDRVVPDFNLPIKLRYGIENRPRQSMFANRFEALKQLIEKVNRILIKNLITNQKNISSLESYDTQPSTISGKYDTAIDTEEELRFVTPTPFVRAEVSPIIVDGRIKDVNIIEKGQGYLNNSYIIISGNGTGAVIKTKIDNKGQLTGVDIINQGVGYDEDTTVLTVRSYCVLVRNDTEASGNWSIYSYEKSTRTWSRIESQSYDTRKYWDYADWYATGYNQFTAADYSVNTFADLSTISVEVGQIVKVRSTQTNSWMLLEKYANSESVDWTQSYKIVGSEKGTIQFSSSLYQFTNTTYGYDGALYDGSNFDNSASTELRIILNCIKNDIFIDDLRPSYLDLFFITVRYALCEQNYLDWIFKTSFVRAQHNVGQLTQKVTYNNDNLENFEDYVSEVKPYRTKIREYVSSYNALDNSETSVTDFDLPSVYNNNKLEPVSVQIVNGVPTSNNSEILSYPWKHWLDNVGFSIIELRIFDGGSNYVSEPVVRFVGNSGTGATARAFISNGKVNRIVLLTPGSGYFSAPTVILDGGLGESGVAARVIAVIGDGVIRSNMIKMKYDRITQSYVVSTLQETETFVAQSGSLLQWSLKWAPDIRVGKATVLIGQPNKLVEALRESYKLSVVKSTAKGYTEYSGKITFTSPPAKGTTIVVTYLKNWDLLNAADRIQYYYNPGVGQAGKSLAQLMTGIDYGGVIVNGMGFDSGYGWNAVPYFTDKWDSLDGSFDDYIVTVSANTHSFVLPYVPAAGTEINVYYTKMNVESFVSDGVETKYYYNLNDINPKATAVVTHTAGTDAINVAGSSTLKLNSTVGVKAGDVVSTYRAVGNISATSSTGNTITLSSTDGLNLNEKILIKGATIGNLTAGTYYVKTILNNTITVSYIPDGPVVTQTNAVGSMAFSAHNIFALGTKVTEVVNSTDVKLDQILYANIDSNSTITFTRDLVVPIDCVIYPNGEVILTNPLDAGTALQISAFLDPVRIDDVNYDTPTQTNKNAVMETWIADGVSRTVFVPETFTVNTGDQFILRKSTSDGSIAPQASDYDTALSGGKDADGFLGYQSATGLNADDIIVDGDGFVTPTTSPAPEEVVPGQVVDSVAIKIYDKQYSASSNIKVDNYIADGERLSFLISQKPNSPQAVIVKADDTVLSIGEDYSVDYVNNTVVFEQIPAEGKLISIFSIGFNGEKILDIDYFIANGGINEFVTNASWTDNLLTPIQPLALVYVDGQILPTTPELFRTDGSYEIANRVGIRFISAPPAGSLINYVIVDSNEQTFAVTKTERFEATGSDTYNLSFDVGVSDPVESSMIVRVGQTILTAPNNSYYTIKGNTATYYIDQNKFLPYSVSVEDIVVIADGVELVPGVDYIVSLSGISIKLNQRIRRDYAGKQMVVSIKSGQGYVYIPRTVSTPPRIRLTATYNAPDVIEVISSYNHNVLDIQRTAINVTSKASLVPNTVDYYNYKNVAAGKILLERLVLNDDYVWVLKNNILLTPSVDFKLNEDKMSIQLATMPGLDDNFTLITFSSNVLLSSFAYMQFKDMLNRVHFKRLNLNKQTKLVEDLKYNDLTIEVADASNFDVPNPALNRPGVVEIAGERIEYFSLNGNILGQLRRGTLGTGVCNIYRAGTYVQDIGPSETIPYHESAVVENVVSDGTNIVPLKFVPTLDITTTAANNTWYRNSIPQDYGQCNDVEVFANGIRLKKVPYSMYNPENAPGSPEGDELFDAEFSVNGTDSHVRLTEPVGFGTHVSVVKRIGTDWGSTLNIYNNNNKIASFIKAVPGIWYIGNKKQGQVSTFDSTSASWDSTGTTFDQG